MLLAHFSATVFMAGVIWFVQVVHYPLFASVAENAAVPYARKHVALTGRIVGPPMLVEVGTAIALWLGNDPASSTPWFLAASALLIVVWVATAILSVPLHRRLSQQPDPAAIRRLVATNWIRTFGWTARVILLVPLMLPSAPLANAQKSLAYAMSWP